MSRKARAELEDVWPREPRCRICRDEAVRILVNELLDWHGAPVILGRGTTHLVTYADILRELEPLNEGVTRGTGSHYDSLWIHAKRHYELAGIVALLEIPDGQGAEECPGGQRGVGHLSSCRRKPELSTTENRSWGMTPSSRIGAYPQACGQCAYRSPVSQSACTRALSLAQRLRRTSPLWPRSR